MPPAAAAARARSPRPVSGTTTGTFGEARSGHTHAGKDIAAPTGTAVRAAQCGTVTPAGADGGGYGNLVCIQHEGGVSTCYAHLSQIDTTKGAYVHVGDVIGKVGCTGSCTGPHLHFEVRENSKAVNPDDHPRARRRSPAPPRRRPRSSPRPASLAVTDSASAAERGGRHGRIGRADRSDARRRLGSRGRRDCAQKRLAAETDTATAPAGGTRGAAPAEGRPGRRPGRDDGPRSRPGRHDGPGAMCAGSRHGTDPARHRPLRRPGRTAAAAEAAPATRHPPLPLTAGRGGGPRFARPAPAETAPGAAAAEAPAPAVEAPAETAPEPVAEAPAPAETAPVAEGTRPGRNRTAPEAPAAEARGPSAGRRGTRAGRDRAEPVPRRPRPRRPLPERPSRPRPSRSLRRPPPRPPRPRRPTPARPVAQDIRRAPWRPSCRRRASPRGKCDGTFFAMRRVRYLCGADSRAAAGSSAIIAASRFRARSLGLPGSVW